MTLEVSTSVPREKKPVTRTHQTLHKVKWTVRPRVWRTEGLHLPLTLFFSKCNVVNLLLGVTGGSVVRICLQCRRCRFDPWAGKTP